MKYIYQLITNIIFLTDIIQNSATICLIFSFLEHYFNIFTNIFQRIWIYVFQSIYTFFCLFYFSFLKQFLYVFYLIFIIFFIHLTIYLPISLQQNKPMSIAHRPKIPYKLIYFPFLNIGMGTHHPTIALIISVASRQLKLYIYY